MSSRMQLYWRALRSAAAHFTHDDLFAAAGNIAFRAVFSLFPFLIFVTALAAFLGDESLARNAIDFVFEVAPEPIADRLAPIINDVLTIQRGGLLTLSAALTVWTASTGIDSLRIGLNRSYGLVDERSMWTVLALNLAFVVAGAISLLLVAVLIVLGPVLWRLATANLPALGNLAVWFDVARFVGTSAFVGVVVFLLHYALPCQRYRARRLIPGVILTVALLMALAAGFSVYVSWFPYFADTYASLAAAIIALVFIYYAALALLFGAELNHALLRHRREREARQRQEAETFAGGRATEPGAGRERAG